MIYIIGIGITFFLSFILLTKKEKSIADNILFVWLSVILIHLILFAIISSQEFISFPYLLGLEIPIPLLHGPFLLLYTTSLTNGNTRTSNKFLHFIPFTLALISIIPFLLLSSEDKIMIYRNEGEAYSIQTNVIFVGILLSGITYIILSLHSLVKHKRMIKDNYSYNEKINLQWLFRLIIGLSCIWIIVLLADDKYIFSSVVLYVIFIGYYGIKQVGVFTNQLPPLISLALETTELSDIPSEKSKYEKSLLTDSQLEVIHGELQLLMKERELYLRPELTLTMVSHELDVHPNTLSQVINKLEKKNFFDYINTLRVEEFKDQAVKPENHKYTLLSLAYECGFNSKTSFNRNFKNITGKSPTEYLKEIQISLK